MTIEDVVLMIDKTKLYSHEVDLLRNERGLSEKDADLLKGIFENYINGYSSIAFHQLTYVGDTYIRELFTEIVLKLSDGGN